MPGYWWECVKCGNKVEFPEACRSRGIAHYIWDVLLPSSWDQTKLLAHCEKCQSDSLRITYEFPRKEKEILHVAHIVGIGPFFEEYIPMMWETFNHNDFQDRLFDFKYINRRSIYGLNKPAVFSTEGLRELFDLYRKKTGIESFP